MPKLLDLANELILAIASHIPRSADKFNLVRVNHKLYDLIILEFYKHILLDQTEDPSKKGDLTQIIPDKCWDTCRLRRLCRVLNEKPHSRKLLVESLSLELDSNTLYDSFAHSKLMLCLPSLKSLCLSGKRSTSSKGGQKSSPMSPSVIKLRLREVSKTLESLIIDLDQGIQFRDGTGIGGFRGFHSLKHLSIQSHVLLNERKDLLFYSQSEDDEIKFDEASLVAILPPRLQRLQLSCWTDREDDYEPHWDHVIALLLGSLMEWGFLPDVPELQEITVYYPIKHDEVHDVQGNDKPDFKNCVAEERWQEVAKMLTDMALKKHRSISVKFEQGSEEGSRSWGETATEPAEIWS